MVDEWFSNKKKTYHKHWELKKGGYAWVLFFVDEADTGAYHTGIGSSKYNCITEIKRAIGIELSTRGVL